MTLQMDGSARLARARVMAAVLPAGEHDPKGAAVGELVAVDADTSSHSAHELALGPASGGPCCCEPCRHASEAPFRST